MREVFIILILLTVTDLFAQTKLNRQDRLTKDEFLELKKNRNQFWPTDMKGDTLVIVRYAPSKLEHLQRLARHSEFATNGEDTTSYTDEKLFGIRQVERGKRIIQKLSTDFPLDRAKALSKKGVRTVVVDEEMLLTTTRYANKYWLTTIYVCDQDGLKGPWVTTITNRIYDPRTKRFYEILLATNYDLLDLVD